MAERSGIITFMGNPLTLVGQEVSTGSPAPDFQCLDNDLNQVSLGDFGGKTCIICSVPSLDTPVCDMETRRFNQDAEKLGDSVKVLTISMDLPFAQARWCGAAGVENVITLSDHRDASFGMAYGVLIKELRLLSRAVFLVDKNGVLCYQQTVNEITEEPDYEAVLKAVAEIV
ncbi:MAG TPA: thiol peroxidase [Thermodesulfobacteriaceae bacterium]|nr:thiol peroxidase [Thermodesulfobacteriaceae bacterium]